MPLVSWWDRTVAPRFRPVAVFTLLGLAVTIVVGVAGFMAGAAREQGRHAAIAVVVTGTVIMSNEGSRFVVFYPDGIVDPPNDADWVYNIIADGWVDASGTMHAGPTYPTCLAGDAESGMSTQRRRVELTTLDWNHGGRQPMHIAFASGAWTSEVGRTHLPLVAL